jgi:deoxyadenosine/deoxycytidine kinase
MDIWLGDVDMGKIIAIVGNSGAGKTTLTRMLGAHEGFTPYWENPDQRPFQAAFTQDAPRWALANQIDFFLFRCQQERTARQRDEIAVFDGGLDQDFHVFTRFIRDKGYLHPDEYDLCQRFFTFARNSLPPPDLILHLQVDIPTLLARRASRHRETIDRLFDPQELTDQENLITACLSQETCSPVLHLNLHQDYRDLSHHIDRLIQQINDRLCAS